MSVLARVFVTLKPGVLDPQGKAIRSSLASLGFADVSDVRLGKYLEVTLGESDPAKARAEVEAMCRKLLANPVIESYRVELP
ncbi:MAG: phosphoribosylformylglycinamidine synthase subunit PurS [Myxococcales bacterium]